MLSKLAQLLTRREEERGGLEKERGRESCQEGTEGSPDSIGIRINDVHKGKNGNKDGKAKGKRKLKTKNFDWSKNETSRTRITGYRYAFSGS